jgi:hypothetical protein
MHTPRTSIVPALALLGAGLASASADSSVVCPTTPNSVGPGATLTWVGPFDPDLGWIVVDGATPNASGIVIYGYQAPATPYGDGSLCSGPISWNLARKRADANGHLVLDIEQEGDADDLLWLDWPGNTEFVFQYMYRDRSGGPAGFNLSEAVLVRWE